jgi:hypothetical protein
MPNDDLNHVARPYQVLHFVYDELFGNFANVLLPLLVDALQQIRRYRYNSHNLAARHFRRLCHLHTRRSRTETGLFNLNFVVLT